jgi:hypothetical protein
MYECSAEGCPHPVSTPGFCRAHTEPEEAFPFEEDLEKDPFHDPVFYHEDGSER